MISMHSNLLVGVAQCYGRHYCAALQVQHYNYVQIKVWLLIQYHIDLIRVFAIK